MKFLFKHGGIKNDMKNKILNFTIFYKPQNNRSKLP